MGAVLIAQISDCHVVDEGVLFVDRIDSTAALSAAIATINALDPRPDLVLATGDLVNDGSPSQYDRLLSVFGDCTVPVLPIPGNHDDRTELRTRFADVLPAGGPTEPIDFVDDRWPLRIVAIDTTIPGRHDGMVSDDQLDWLDRTLASEPDRPTVVVQHHPPVASGLGPMDARYGLTGGGAEAAVLRGHPQVEAVLCGHVHRSFQRRYAGTIAISCPSTASQLALTLGDVETRYTDEPTGLLVHHWQPGNGLVSHLVPIGHFSSWTPSWHD